MRRRASRFKLFVFRLDLAPNLSVSEEILSPFLASITKARCSSTERLDTSSALNGHVSEPYSSTEFAAAIYCIV